MVLNILWWLAFIPAILFWVDVYRANELNTKFGRKLAYVGNSSKIPGLIATAYIIYGLFV